MQSLIFFFFFFYYFLFVTDFGYENPKFVEDILRDGVLAMRGLEGLGWFSLACENFESIHNHSAYAAHEETIGE